jgi:hypothetical protein
MEDIIDIIVTETTNLITITSSESDEVIDVNIIDNREDIVLNVTPTVVEININSLVGNFGVNWGQIGGTLTNQTDLNTALGLKADLVGGKVPSSQLPSYVDDVVEVANYAALPATGETGKIYVTIDTNYIYRWTGSVYVEIKDSSAVWGAITGTLSNQTDLQNALNAKFDDPIGDATQYIDGTGALQTFPVLASADKLILVVRNTSGATITKGTVVYINGANGNKPTIAKALATGDATSAQTLGLVQTNIANNSNGNVVLVGSVIDLDTSAFTEGQQLYLSGVTAGVYTATKTLAPTHLVYVGVIARAHPTLGVIEVKIQNGYELDEIHDVSITSEANNQGLFYEASTDLWKNKSIATVLGYTPEQSLTFNSPLSRSTNAVSIPAATTSVNGYLTSTDWTTFNNKIGGSGLTEYYARFTSSGVITDGFISTSSNITTVAGMGLTTQNGLNIEGNYGAGGGGQKIRSFDETTGIAYIDFANTGGRFYLGVNKSTSGGLMTNATAYATVLTTGLGTTNLEFGTNLTKRLTLDGTTGAATFTSTISANGATLTGALSGTSAMFSGEILNSGGQLAFSGSGGQPSTGVGIRYNGTFYIYPGANGFNVRNSSNTVNNLFVADSGAATFSGSVKSNTLFSVGTGSGKFFGVGSDISGSFASTDLVAYNTGGDLYLLSTGAVGVIVKASTGNVGIGTAAPSSILDIRQNNLPRITLVKNSVISWYIGNPAQSTSNNFSIGTDSGGNTNILNITNTGSVGIGTTAPQTLLSIETSGVQNTISPIITSQSSGTTYTGMYSIRDGAGDQRGLIFQVYTANVGLNEKMRITSGGDVLIGVTSSTYSTTNRTAVVANGTSTSLYGLAVGGVNKGYFFSDNTNILLMSESATGFMSFGTANSERMRITSAGNVGIGTTAPLNPLTVSSTIGYGAEFYRNNNLDSRINITNTTTTSGSDKGLMLGEIGVEAYFYNYANGPAIFGTNGTERMRITSAGNVGINTTFAPGPNGLGIAIYKNDFPRISFRNSTTGDQASGGFQFYLNGNDFYQESPAATIFANGGTERMRITSDGNLLFNTTNNNGSKVRLSAATGWTTEIINNNASNQQLFMLFTYGSTGLGSIQGNGSTVSYFTTSDYRLKEDLKSINGLEIVNKIKVYDYKWKASENRMDGVLAHELAEVLPYAVTGIKDGEQMQSVDYSKIVPVMVQAIKDLKAELDTLKNK